MNKLYTVCGIGFLTWVFYCAYAPQKTLKQQIDETGLEFEYVTDEGSCFTSKAEPIGPGSSKFIISLNPTAKPTNKQEPLYVMIGYMMKEVRLKNKSNVFQFHLSNTL